MLFNSVKELNGLRKDRLLSKEMWNIYLEVIIDKN